VPFRTPAQALTWAKEQSTDPTPPAPDKNWKNLCLMFCRMAYDVPSTHFADDPEKVNDARTAWEHTKHRGDKDKQPPAGALMWWIRADQPEDTTEDGHIWSNDIRDTPDRQGGIYRVPSTEISDTWTALTYAGWSRDVNDVLVVERDMDLNDKLTLTPQTAKALGFDPGTQLSVGELLQASARNAAQARRNAALARDLADKISHKVGLTADEIEQIHSKIDAGFSNEEG
jgi:hypothetical protein